MVVSATGRVMRTFLGIHRGSPGSFREVEFSQHKAAFERAAIWRTLKTEAYPWGVYFWNEQTNDAGYLTMNGLTPAETFATAEQPSGC